MNCMADATMASKPWSDPELLIDGRKWRVYSVKSIRRHQKKKKRSKGQGGATANSAYRAELVEPYSVIEIEHVQP